MKLIKYFFVLLAVGLPLLTLEPALAVGALDGLDNTAKAIPAYQEQVKIKSARTAILDRVGGVVGLILSFVGIIFLILTVYAGLMWMTAQGNAGQVDKAKDLLINAIIGLVIVTAAYSITIFIGGELVK